MLSRWRGSLLVLLMACCGPGFVRADMAPTHPLSHECNVAAGATNVPAGLCPGCRAHKLIAGATNVALSASTPVADRDGFDSSTLWMPAAADWSLGHLLDRPIVPRGLMAGAEPVDTRQIKELPPVPSSAVMFLSAVLCFGAWHLGRSVRHLHLGALPEWYHAGGPLQIGHAKPFDMDSSALPVCCFDQPARQRPFLYRVRREDVPRRACQCFLIITAPRGPPAVS